MTSKGKYSAVMIGSSFGGVAALRTLLAPLPNTFPVPVIIVQHLNSLRHSDLVTILGRSISLRVLEAKDKMPLMPSCVFVAPPDYHLYIERDKSLSLSVDPPVHYCRPSIDVAFESGANVFGRELIGVIITGGNEDGARGLRRIKEKGGYVMVQDASEAEAPMMPLAALNAVSKPDFVGHLSEITGQLFELSSEQSQ